MYLKVEVFLQQYNTYLNIVDWTTLKIMTKIKPVEPSEKKAKECL